MNNPASQEPVVPKRSRLFSASLWLIALAHNELFGACIAAAIWYDTGSVIAALAFALVYLVTIAMRDALRWLALRDESFTDIEGIIDRLEKAVADEGAKTNPENN